MKRIVSNNGNLWLEIDGKTIAPIAYMSYLPARADYEKFRALGYNLFSACIYMGDKPVNEISGVKPFAENIWRSRESFDFSPLDRVVKQALGDEYSGYLLLRVNINTPSWWREENPDEVVVLGNGKKVMQSSFSEKWIRDATLFFNKLKEHIETSTYAENIIAWQIGAMNTEEWIAPVDDGFESDFSPCAQKAFAAWCENRYATLSALNGAWDTKWTDFSKIQIPSMERRAEYNKDPIVDTQRHAWVIDYYRCLNESYAVAIERLCAYVKSIFNGDILVGTFYGYIGQLGVNYGHCALSRLLHSKHIDFFASPFAYTAGRKTADDWFYHSAMQSCKDAGKLWFMEADIRTWKTKALCEVAPEIVDKDNERMKLPVWFGADTEKESLWHLVRAFGKVLTSGNAFWWFDMWGGWYDTPAMLRFMDEARKAYGLAMQERMQSVGEVAVVLDENAAFGMNIRYGGQACYQQLVWLSFAGAPYDLYLKGDAVVSVLQKYKCVIYLAPFALTAQDEKDIKALDERGISVVLTAKAYDIAGERVYAPRKVLNEEELRVYYERAGVHTYIEKTGLVFANERFICITAADDGEYELRMPCDCQLSEVFGQERYQTHDCKIVLSMQRNETKLFTVVRSDK